MSRYIGVLGAGSFGTAVARLLSKNCDVLMYSRRQDVVDRINNEHKVKDHELSPRIKATTDLAQIGQECHLIFHWCGWQIR